jgi:hypothetical protein
MCSSPSLANEVSPSHTITTFAEFRHKTTWLVPLTSKKYMVKTSPSLALLSAEIIANVLEYLSSKPVILFSTMRGISRLFHQGVVLNFERHYFQKRTPKLSNWPEFFLPDAFEATTRLSFSAVSPRVLRTFLTLLPWVSEACLQSVETLSVPYSHSEDTFRTLGRWLPNVRNLQLSGGAVEEFTKETADTVANHFPLLRTLDINGCIDETARDTLVTKLLAKENCRLRMEGDLLLGLFDSSPLDTLKPYAELLSGLTWLELRAVDLGTFDLFPHCANLEVLALSNVSVRESLFRKWKIFQGGRQRKSLRSLELRSINFTDWSSSPQVPPSEEVDEFFSLNPDLISLVMDLKAEEFPNSWAGSVGRHCRRLQYLSFTDSGLPLEDLEVLAMGLKQLKFVHIEMWAETLQPERMALLARFGTLKSLNLAAIHVPALPLVALPNLEEANLLWFRARSDEITSLLLGSPKLRRIALSGWNQPLLDAVADNCPLLVELELALGGREMLESEPDLSRLLKQCRLLNNLSVETNQFDGRILNDVIAQRAQLSSLTIRSVLARLGVNEACLKSFVQNLPTCLSTLSLNLNLAMAEVVCHELSQRTDLDLRSLSLSNQFEEVWRYCCTWKENAKAIFPHLTLD